MLNNVINAMLIAFKSRAGPTYIHVWVDVPVGPRPVFKIIMKILALLRKSKNSRVPLSPNLYKNLGFVPKTQFSILEFVILEILTLMA